MEKLGIAKADLLTELKDGYRDLCELESKLVKLGTHISPTDKGHMAAIKARIDELEGKDGGETS